MGAVYNGEVSITNCIIDGSITGASYVGGAVGYCLPDSVSILIDNVINYAVINASSNYGAGFIGRAQAPVKLLILSMLHG